MNIFQELAERQIKCEACSSETIAMYGQGWDYDRIVCSNRDCSAEYVFPTTTTIENKELTI